MICSGSGYTLTGSGASLYFWFNTPTTAYTNNPLPFIAGTPGPRSYTLIGLASNGCQSQQVPISFSVEPKPTVTATPATPTVCIGGTVNLTASGASSYAWSGAGTSSANPFTFTAPGAPGTQTFMVIGIDANGCKDTANTSVNAVQCPVGIFEQDKFSETKIYPNPFTTEIFVSAHVGTIEVYNAVGQMVIAAEISRETSVKTADLAKGVYIVKAYNTSGELVKTVKLMKN